MIGMRTDKKTRDYHKRRLRRLLNTSVRVILIDDDNSVIVRQSGNLSLSCSERESYVIEHEQDFLYFLLDDVMRVKDSVVAANYA